MRYTDSYTLHSHQHFTKTDALRDRATLNRESRALAPRHLVVIQDIEERGGFWYVYFLKLNPEA